MIVRQMLQGRSAMNMLTRILVFKSSINKTDKLNCLPYDFYHGNLYNAILRSNAMVIVGYSFGDLYVNNPLYKLYLATLFFHAQDIIVQNLYVNLLVVVR